MRGSMAWLGLAMAMTGAAACGDDTGGGSGGGGTGGDDASGAVEACRQQAKLCSAAGELPPADDPTVAACAENAGARCAAKCFDARQSCEIDDAYACADECNLGTGGGSGTGGSGSGSGGGGGGGGGGTDPCQELTDCCEGKADDDPEKESCTDIANNDRTGEERDIYCENGLSSFCQ